MDSAGRHHKNIAGLHRMPKQNLFDAVVGDTPQVFFAAQLFVEARNQLGLRPGTYHIPKFGLAETLSQSTGKGIVGMYLNGKIGGRVYPFHQQRKLLAVTFEDLAPQQALGIDTDEFFERFPSEWSVFKYRHMVFHCRNLPTFAGLTAVEIHLFKFGQG